MKENTPNNSKKVTRKPPRNKLSTKARIKDSAWKEELGEWLFRFGPFFLICLLLLGAGFFLAREFLPNLSQPGVVESQWVAGETEESNRSSLEAININSIRDLYEAVLAAHGGRTQLEQVDSIQMRGKMEANGMQLDFYLTRKHPDMALLKLKAGNYEVTDGSIGGVHWRRIDVAGAEDTYELLSPTESSSMTKSRGSLYDPLLAYLLKRNSNKGSYSSSTYKGKASYLINFEKDEKALQAEVDAETFLTLALKEPVTSNGVEKELLMDFSDYKLVGDIMIPFETNIYVDGKLTQSIEMSSAETNIGVISSIFELPEELREN